MQLIPDTDTTIIENAKTLHAFSEELKNIAFQRTAETGMIENPEELEQTPPKTVEEILYAE